MISLTPLEDENGYAVKFNGKCFDFLINTHGNLLITVYAGPQVTEDTPCRDIIVEDSPELKVTTDSTGIVQDKILEKLIQSRD